MRLADSWSKLELSAEKWRIVFNPNLQNILVAVKWTEILTDSREIVENLSDNWDSRESNKKEASDRLAQLHSDQLVAPSILIYWLCPFSPLAPFRWNAIFILIIFCCIFIYTELRGLFTAKSKYNFEKMFHPPLV